MFGAAWCCPLLFSEVIMKLSEFIKKNKNEIDEAIGRAMGFVPRQASCTCPKRGTDHYHPLEGRLNNDDRRQWILNDEGLYNWARSEGVKI